MISALPRLTTSPAPAPPKAPPAVQAAPFDSVQIAKGTLAAAAFCAASSGVLCGAAATVASLAGLPFFSGTAVAAAMAGSALFGAALTVLTMRKPLTAATPDEAATARQGIPKNLPNLPRDSASMVIAEHAFQNGLTQAAQAKDASAAATAGAEGAARMGNILGHGAFRTTSLVLGTALGISLASTPLVGAPLGFAGGFAVSYLLDKPGHWLGTAAGKAIGAVAGRIAHHRAQ